MKITQVVILAGGLGTRLRPFTKDNPKPMYSINGKPFLEYLINQVREAGFREVLLLLGYMPDKIVEYFGDGSRWGIKINYQITPVEYETGKRILDAEPLLNEEFFLMYSDNYCPVHFGEAERQFVMSDKDIQITAYSNKDGYTKNNILCKKGSVIKYDKTRRAADLNAVDIGYAFVKKKVIKYLPNDNANFEIAVYEHIVNDGKMGCYLTDHRYYSIGSWGRMPLTEDFFRLKKVVFLDRDGTLNRKPQKADYVKNPSEFHWLEGAREAIKRLKEKGYEVYVVSNQPGIVRGKMTKDDLYNIQKRMEDDLFEIGVSIDGWYYCMHGWDDGCDCRKPMPGLFYQAQKEHSLDLTKCILFGDDERDIEAGRRANLKKCIKISDSYTLLAAVKDLEYVL